MAATLKQFFKEKKVNRENVKYAPTESLVDEAGKPLEFEFKRLTTREDDTIRDTCMSEVPITGKMGAYRPKLDTSKYLAKMVATCCVFPDLFNAELQDSYGVSKPEELILELVDNPGEYQNLCKFVQDLNGFKTLEEEVKEAKN